MGLRRRPDSQIRLGTFRWFAARTFGDCFFFYKFDGRLQMFRDSGVTKYETGPNNCLWRILGNHTLEVDG